MKKLLPVFLIGGVAALAFAKSKKKPCPEEIDLHFSEEMQVEIINLIDSEFKARASAKEEKQVKENEEALFEVALAVFNSGLPKECHLKNVKDWKKLKDNKSRINLTFDVIEWTGEEWGEGEPKRLGDFTMQLSMEEYFWLSLSIVAEYLDSIIHKILENMGQLVPGATKWMDVIYSNIKMMIPLAVGQKIQEIEDAANSVRMAANKE